MKLTYISHQRNIAETGSIVNVIANVTHVFIGSVLLKFDCGVKHEIDTVLEFLNYCLGYIQFVCLSMCVNSPSGS